MLNDTHIAWIEIIGAYFNFAIKFGLKCWGTCWPINTLFTTWSSWLNIGDFQAISNNRICPATTSDMIKTSGHGIPYYIPGNKKVSWESELVDNGKFVLNSLFCLFVLPAISVYHPVPCKLLKKKLIIVPAGWIDFFVFQAISVKLQRTVVQ